jgi:CO/xanthine dehydrogenase Mo-binding subunit
MVHQSYIEPHATLVQLDPLTGGFTIWSNTQMPFLVREEVASILGIPDSDVRVIGTPVGGGFGGKIVLYEPLVAMAARLVGRPVKLVLSRLEELSGSTPAPASKIRIRLGAKRDGTFTALEASIAMDSGCFNGGSGGPSAYLIGSLYRVPNLFIDMAEVLTFKAATGAYRAPGGPQADFALESVVNELSDALDMDPLELRLKNASRPGDLTSDNKPWPNMGMHEVLKALQAHPAWQQREAARAAGRGVSIAIGGWNPGTAASAALCGIERDGTIHVQVGSTDLSGTATSFALMAAEILGVPVEQVRVKLNDTASALYAAGAAGSVTTYSVGPAVVAAARDARAQVLAMAADEFEADPEDLEIVGGMIRVRGVPDRAITLRELAEKTMKWDASHGPIYGRGSHADPTQSPAFSAQLAEVDVDRETGAVQIHRLVIAQDAGRAINPLAVEGQLMGGATQGIGWALYERMAYDEQGQLVTGSWMDYAVPAATQAATRYETIIVEVPSEHGPFGARGVGEPPVIATAAAVANAIADATGVRMTELPMSAPRLFAALAEQNGQ